jgi:hypothetical protein
MSASPESLTLLERAANLRALGNSWDETAQQLAVDQAELQQLASEHNRDYERLSRRARNELHRQAVGTALVTLIRLMRSTEPGVGILAATTFVRYDAALMRHCGKEAALRLERDMRQLDIDEARTATREMHEPHARNVRESTEVKNQQGVASAKNVAKSPPSASAPAPKPTDADARRRRQLLGDAVLSGAPRTPLPRGNRQELEAERLLTSILPDDAPAG